jgi:protein involved in polysaccharide export with SLBB domain
MHVVQRLIRHRAGGRRRPGRALAALALVGLSAGCTYRQAYPPNLALPIATAGEPGSYRVQPGDLLEVKFLYHQNENQRLAVRPDGGLALAITGDLDAAGLTLDELEDLIRARAARFLRDPVVSVTVAESGARAYVGGEVTSAGFVSLGKPMNVIQAVFERGGFTSGADISDVMVIQNHADGEVVVRRLDVGAAMKENSLEGAMLQPNDVVFVPKTGIARANTWVSQWIDGLTPEILKSVRTGPVF